MVDAVIDNVFLVNAPAGSGKTTKIKSMIVDQLITNPKDNILCITYTNRAADELKKGLNVDNVFFGTIHSFLNNFISIYFRQNQIIDLYFEVYGEEIRKRIANVESDANKARSNEKYVLKYGTLTYESVRHNIKSIFYNETQFNSLYNGGLSHDDLISFTKSIADKFPVIKNRLTQKYQLIFIDEYQDSSANVLKMFFEAVSGTSTRLYLLGDKMQQIYKNYDGSFENELPKLNKSISLNTNHRSIPKIINILNGLYNDNSFKQNPSPANIDVTPDHLPRVLICDNILKKLEAEKIKFPNTLVLFLFNQERFESIGAGNLYKQLGKMDRYSFVQKYSAVNVITDESPDNPDPLLKLLFALSQITEYFSLGNLGSIIQLLRKSPKMFDKEMYNVIKHEDKARLSSLLNEVINKYNDVVGQPNDIAAVIATFKETGLVKSEYIEAITDSGEYSEILTIKISEFREIARYLRTPNVSTQHGVKGESHDTVFFVAEDSKTTPVVHMYSFFELWSATDLSLNSFETFYYDYLQWINETIMHLGFKLSAINKELYSQHEEYLKTRIVDTIDHFNTDSIFGHICKKSYEDFLSNPNLTNIKKCFNENQVYGTLCAYRLFYVGCSRAKRNLSIFIEKSKISDFSLRLAEKFRSIGFLIE